MTKTMNTATEIICKCLNCNMNLTVYNKSGYCSSFCEQKHKGIEPDTNTNKKKEVVIIKKVVTPTKPITKPNNTGQINIAGLEPNKNKIDYKSGGSYKKAKLSIYNGTEELHTENLNRQDLRNSIKKFSEILSGCTVSIIFEDNIE